MKIKYSSSEIEMNDNIEWEAFIYLLTLGIERWKMEGMHALHWILMAALWVKRVMLW